MMLSPATQIQKTTALTTLYAGMALLIALAVLRPLYPAGLLLALAVLQSPQLPGLLYLPGLLHPPALRHLLTMPLTASRFPYLPGLLLPPSPLLTSVHMSVIVRPPTTTTMRAPSM